MHSDAFRRARKLLRGHPREAITARMLGVAHSLLLLSLLAVAGLLVALLVGQGEAQSTTARRALLKHWEDRRVVGGDGETTRYENAGLLPLVTGSLSSRNPVHRQFARSTLAVLRRMPSLRNNLGALTTLLATGLGLQLLLSVVAAYRRSLIADATSEVASALRRQMHRQMYRQGHSSLPTEGVGPVVNLFTREVNDVRLGLFNELDLWYRIPIFVGGLLLFSLGVAWLPTIFLASLGGLVWLSTRAMNRAFRQASGAATRDAAVQLCLLHEDLGLLRTVRVHGMENLDKSRFDGHLELYRRADSQRVKTEGRMNPRTGLLYGATAVMAIGYLGYLVVVAHQLAPAAAIVLAASLFGLIHPSLQWIGMKREAHQASRSASAIMEYLDQSPDLQQTSGAHFLSPLRREIAFEGITLTSRSGRVLLDNVTARLPAGTRTAIMGLEDDAKHALVCLIPRLIDPQVGRVQIDGHDLREMTLESIRAQVATVLQADLVFTDTVAANIGLGDPRSALPLIIEAAKVAHAHHFIQDLPHGYDTVIGPLGHYLKPDEQYRIALARAILHDASIVIIEEPNVALDDDTKQLLDDTISRLGHGRTLIFLPHRLSTIRSCSQVIVLHNGRVEAVGDPRQLQGESKLYRHLQYVEFNQFAAGEIEAGQMSV